MLFQGVDGERPRRISRRRQDIGLTTHAQNVRGMPAPGTFCVVSMDGTTAEGGDRVLDKSSLVQRVGVNCYLYIVLFCHPQTAVDGGGCCAPVLVQLQPQRPRFDLFTQRLWHRAITFTQKS